MSELKEGLRDAAYEAFVDVQRRVQGFMDEVGHLLEPPAPEPADPPLVNHEAAVRAFVLWVTEHKFAEATPFTTLFPQWAEAFLAELDESLRGADGA